MNLEITSRHYEAPLRLKEYVENEVKKLHRLGTNIVDCKVLRERSKEGDEVEILVHISGKDLNTNVISDDMYKSVDLAVQKIERQLKRYKGKRYTK